MQTARLLSQLLSFVLTSFAFFNELGGLLVLVGIGIITNSIAALFLLGIPYREKNYYSKKRNLLTVFRRTIRNREQVIVILVRCLSLSGAVLIGFIIPFMRVVLGLPQNLVFLYSVVGTLGMISSGLLLRPFVDSVGSKPLLLSAFLGQTITLLFWSMLGPSTGYGGILVLGFITTFLQAAVFQLVARLVINVIPAQDKISFMSLLNFITALFAFGTGILGGRLIDLGEYLALAVGSSYTFAFASGAVSSVVAFLLVLAVRDSGSLRVREAATILFSLRNLRTFLDIYNFHLTDDPVKKQTILTAIKYSPAPQAEPELRQILNNPITPDKDQILISLYNNPRPRLLDLIVREAENPDSPHRRNAIFALGAYNHAASKKALVRLYACDDVGIRCAAAKSLARIGNAPPPEELEKQLISNGLPTRGMQDLMIALSVDDREEFYLQRLFSLVHSSRGEYHQQAILSLAARLAGFAPPLDEIYARESDTPGTGLALLLEEARSFQPFFESTETIRRQFHEHRWNELMSWCRGLVGEVKLQRNPVADSLLKDDPGEAGPSLALGTLYLIFQLLNAAPRTE